MILNYNNEIIHIEVVRSKRTTLCISIQKDGSVLIKAPLFLDEHKIREILEKKSRVDFGKTQGSTSTAESQNYQDL
mgnify:CR=1 FL=1